MRTLILSLFLAAFASSASAGPSPSKAEQTADQKNVISDWRGTLQVGGSELHLVLHIVRAGDAAGGGGFTATLDSTDQGALGIAVTSITLTGAALAFRIESIGGSYEGKLRSDGSAIVGTWSQGQKLPLTFVRAPVHETSGEPARPSEIDGAWLGTLDGKLRLVLHFTNTREGLTVTLDSLDQGAKGIPATSVTRKGSALTLAWKLFDGKFEGVVSPDFATIEGTWSQGPSTSPLRFKRVKSDAELERRRPQKPVPPFPYREEEVTVENRAASIRLGGTLTLPRDGGPFPAVFLITGSGAQDRDESLMGHQPFLVLADYLTRRGIAVLRVDDRGVGKSGGDFSKATMLDFATDAEAAWAYLKSRPDIDPLRIGLIGHSEGGEIAPLVAARNPEVAFIVMMAGPGVRGYDILLAQTRRIAETSGKSPAEVEKASREERDVLDMVEREKDDAILEKKLRARLAGSVPDARIPALLEQVRTPWFRFFLTYDPATALARVRCPVLAINGEKDVQVPPRQNLPAIRKALEAGGNPRFEAVELPGLNHLFQTATTGGVAEYAEIEETISPAALEKIGVWVSGVVEK